MTSLRPTLADWNGDQMPLEDVKVSVLDRAFLFGDAVYEALRVYGGKPWLADEHFDRLARSLREIRIEANLERLRSRMVRLIERSGVLEGLVYIQVTRGQGPRSHAWKSPLTPNELLWVQDYGRDPFESQRRFGCGVLLQRDRRWGRCDVKSVNLLANCMACQEAFEAGCLEAILVAADGSLTEATHSSLFAVLDGVVRTAPSDERILPGVTRNWVVDRLRENGMAVVETPIHESEIGCVSEVFLTGTSIEVMPVVSIDGKPVGFGRCGPIAERMRGAYQAAVADFVNR